MASSTQVCLTNFLRKILSGAEKTNVIKWHRHRAMPLLIESFMSKKKYVGAASHSHEDNPLVVEARMQTKALGTLSVYRRAAYSGIAIGAWLIYLSVYGSLSTSSMAMAVLMGGIVLLVISVPIAGILHVGISRGKKNVEKIIKAIEKNSSKNA